ncbi:ASB2 [Symbiodinium sp. CCMP2592]|nr:ASB2 [Symbiodinium sp. CCMP2592]
MSFNYDAGYGEKDVIGMFDSIAPNWRKSTGDVAGLETGRLYEALKRMYEEWKALEDFEVLDRNFQALLALAAATSWFTKEQLDDIDTWLGEVADCGEAEDWMQHFPEEELREVVLEKLRAREAQVVFDTVAKAISVEYEGGNFGTGRHDGSIQLNDDGLTIRDSREPGKSMVFLGDLPEDPAQLGKALGSRNWDEHWDEDCTADRRPILPEEAAAFFHAIDARDAAGFGIRKLATLDIDGLHEAPACISWERSISLIYYAAWRKRDHFVNALLHARANPSVRDEGLSSSKPAGEDAARQIVDSLRRSAWCEHGMESAAVASDASSLGATTEVWLMRALVQLRFRGRRVESTRHCEVAKHAFGSEQHASPAAEVPALVSEAKSGYAQSASAPEKKEDWNCSHCGYVNFARRQTCRNCDSLRNGALENGDVPAADERSSCAVDEEQTLLKRWEAWAASTRREAMLEQFLTLPEAEAPEAAPKVLKAPRFQAQHPREAASAHLGATQQERTAELHKAAAAGDTLRLLALFEAGVDVDAVNEYGQSPVFLAAYHDAAEVISLLVWAGADIDRPANGGTSAWACAAAIGHEGAARALVEAGARRVPVQRSAVVGAEPDPSFQWLITLDSDAAGAGSCILDDTLADDFLCQVDHLFASLPVAARTKSCSSDRSYYCDSEGWIQEAFQRAFLAAQDKHRELVDLQLEVTMPHMRFLHYADVGGGLPPHLDLVRTDEKGRRSTHTFILYLSDCSGGGGETVLLHRMEDNAKAVLAAVEPRRGRLLLFPHLCPHLARPTVVVPKLLLRGEVRLCAAQQGKKMPAWYPRLHVLMFGTRFRQHV